MVYVMKLNIVWGELTDTCAKKYTLGRTRWKINACICNIIAVCGSNVYVCVLWFPGDGERTDALSEKMKLLPITSVDMS